MLKISAWHGDLSESYLRYVTQLGVDCLDFGAGDYFPGVKEQGLSRLGRRDKNKKKNPFLGAGLQPRDPAGHN